MRSREIAPDIYQLTQRTVFGVGAVHFYLLRSSEGLILVDTGPLIPSEEEGVEVAIADFLKALEDLGYSPRDLRALLITHGHIDHFGLAGRIQQMTDVELWVHERDREALSDFENQTRDRALQLNRLCIPWGVPADFPPTAHFFYRQILGSAEQARVDYIWDAECIFSLANWDFQVWETPGHSPGHVMLTLPDRRIILAGDHVLARISPNPDVYPDDRSGLIDYVASLPRIAGRLTGDRPWVSLPGHGSVIQDTAARLRSLEVHHEERSQAIWQLLSQGPTTLYDLSVTCFPAIAPDNRILALKEIYGHLTYLKGQGLVDTSTRDDGAQIWMRKHSRQPSP